MFFPIDISYKKQIQSKYETVNTWNIITHELKKKKVENIEVKKNKLIFKRPWFIFESNFALMVGIDSGEFLFVKERGALFLKYKFSTIRIWMIGLLAPSILGLIAVDLKVFLVLFVACNFLVILNWITSIVRHKLFFDKLSSKFVK